MTYWLTFPGGFLRDLGRLYFKVTTVTPCPKTARWFQLILPNLTFLSCPDLLSWSLLLHQLLALVLVFFSFIFSFHLSVWKFRVLQA